MPTGPSVPRSRRYRPLLALVAGLLVALATSGGAMALPDKACETDRGSVQAATSARPATVAEPDVPPPADEPADDEASTGLDLEVRIGRIRIEFPWLRALPITPGRHVVLELIPPRS